MTYEFRNPTPESQIFVKGNRKDLQILVKDKQGNEHKLSVDYDKILNLERNVIYVELDYTNKEDNQMEVEINVNQGEEKKRKTMQTCILVRAMLAATRRESMASLVSLPEIEEPVKKKPSERLNDEFLMTVADEIETDELLESLMEALAISTAARNRCLETNRCEGRVTTKGTKDMLYTWRAKTEVSKQRSRFKKALKKAKLLDLRGRLFPEED